VTLDECPDSRLRDVVFLPKITLNASQWKAVKENKTMSEAIDGMKDRNQIMIASEIF